MSQAKARRTEAPAPTTYPLALEVVHRFVAHWETPIAPSTIADHLVEVGEPTLVATGVLGSVVMSLDGDSVSVFLNRGYRKNGTGGKEMLAELHMHRAELDDFAAAFTKAYATLQRVEACSRTIE